MIEILSLILAASLSKPDVLTLKSGESYEGEFIRKKGTEIIFRVESDEHRFIIPISDIDKFPISDIETIKTDKWGVLTYPFDKPHKKIFIANAVVYCCVMPIIVLWAIATGPG